MFYKKHNFKRLFILVLCFICTSSLYAQSINGPTQNIYTGDTNNYSVSGFTGQGYYFIWYTDGIISATNGNTHSGEDIDSVSITWSTPGSKIVDVEFEDESGDDSYYDTIYPTVTGSSAPDTPTAPTVQSTNCGNTVLQRSTPPSGVTWYWQSIASGTSTSDSLTTITRTSGTIYYLRAKNSSNVWSTGSSSINYTINQPSTWYEDTDGDGFGDPSATQSSCTQPLGYVNNNNDLCPTNFGIDNGCPTVTSNGDQNYIYTITPSEPTSDISTLDNDEKIENITYFDGLGRAKQNISIRAGGNSEDIITHIEYDHIGRITKDYLPYSATSTGGTYRTDGLVTTNSFYDTTKYENTLNPYSEKHIESSPLNRVLEQAAPGADWALDKNSDTDHTIKFEYEPNVANEVKLFSVSLSYANNTYTPTLTGGTTYYTADELYKTITKDENWTSGTNHTTEEFKDRQGRVILKRTYANISGVSTAHDTYYVYDDYGNLSFVLPPKVDTTDGISATELSELCYQYKYDDRNRLVEKKIPGKGLEYIIYNKLDLPILIQDAIQKQNGEWLFTKYDAFGRVTYTGKATCATTTTREAIQTEVNAFVGDLWVTQSTTSSNYGGVNVYYNNGAYPDSSSASLVTLSEILTINYYDSYVDRPTGAPTSVVLMESTPSETNTVSVKGLETVSKVKVLDVTGTNVWINTLSYYDAKSRPIYVYSENTYLGTVDVIETKLDFLGKPLKSKTTHTKNGITIATIDNYTYDHVGRLITQTQCIGDETMGFTCSGSSATVVDLALTGDITTDQVASHSIIITNGTIFPDTRLWISPEIQEVIVDNTYDALGQLESKGVGGTVLNTNRLQTVDYTYNVRGWLKQINDPQALGNDLFSFKLNYNTTELGSTNTELYNGNISETIWKTANDNSSNSTRAYAYTYDALNRITSADYGIKSSGGFNLSSGFDVGIGGYDKNGNILSLWRDDITNSNKIDQLTYNYDNNEVSNKLKVVNDTSGSTEGFNNGANTTNEYTYDANGNMTQDDNKGITAITYNHLNLPTQVTLVSGNISYIYDASGVKLEKVVSEGSSVTTTKYAGNWVYEKIGTGSDVLKFFNHPEGYVDAENGYDYVYQYKDHLGNVRLSYKDNNGTLEILEENNYYPFGLKHQGYNNNPTSSNIALKWKYNDVEYEEALGLDLYEMPLRQYDPTIGRFNGIDPIVHHSMSTYTAFDNNPVFWADPSGADALKLGGGIEPDDEYHRRMRAKSNFDNPFGYISSNIGYSTRDSSGGGPGDPPVTYNGPGVVTGEGVVNALPAVCIGCSGSSSGVQQGLDSSGYGLNMQNIGVAATTANTAGTIITGSMESQIPKLTKADFLIKRFDPKFATEFLNTNVNPVMGNVYEPGAKQALNSLNNLRVGVKVIGVGGNIAGYSTAYQELNNGNYAGTATEAASATASWRIGAIFGWARGLGWGVGWEWGRHLSTKEWYNRYLFGTGSYIYQKREKENAWIESVLLKE